MLPGVGFIHLPLVTSASKGFRRPEDRACFYATDALFSSFPLPRLTVPEKGKQRKIKGNHKEKRASRFCGLPLRVQKNWCVSCPLLLEKHVKGLNIWGVGRGSLQNMRARIAVSLESRIWQKCGFNTLLYVHIGRVRFTFFFFLFFQIKGEDRKTGAFRLWLPYGTRSQTSTETMLLTEVRSGQKPKSLGRSSPKLPRRSFSTAILSSCLPGSRETSPLYLHAKDTTEKAKFWFPCLDRLTLPCVLSKVMTLADPGALAVHFRGTLNLEPKSDDQNKVPGWTQLICMKRLRSRSGGRDPLLR